MHREAKEGEPSKPPSKEEMEARMSQVLELRDQLKAMRPPVQAPDGDTVE